MTNKLLVWYALSEEDQFIHYMIISHVEYNLPLVPLNTLAYNVQSLV